jgi:DNA-binding CsgD family transcriptional regulator
MPVVVLVINLVPLIRLKYFLKIIFPQEIKPLGPGPLQEHLINKYRFTPREQQIIELICRGKNNREIGTELFISGHTVKEYIYRVYKKTGVKNRVQLANLLREYKNY